jgi:hypothetical protein
MAKYLSAAHDIWVEDSELASQLESGQASALSETYFE